MTLLYDYRINNFVKLRKRDVEVVNKCEELMLQAVTFASEGKDVSAYFNLARVERDKFVEATPAWNLCENKITEAIATILVMPI